MSSDNQEKNIEHYNKRYNKHSIKNTLYWLKNLDAYLDFAIQYETSWNAIYSGQFRNRINGKKILEMGSGDCHNAAVMAALGAEVYANDIAPACERIVDDLNRNFNFKTKIKFVGGDFLENQIEKTQFDFIIGKAFLHHLPIPVEKEFLKETSKLLKEDGEARFFEPAVNSKILDEVRWLIPVKGRPSKLNRKKFENWRNLDPHPNRSFSSRHFIETGKEFFEECEILPMGTLDRFRRLINDSKLNARYAKWALQNEKCLPKYLNYQFARSQLIIYRKPKV